MTLSELLKSTRQYFWAHDFEEVEVPYLNESLPLEPNIYPFSTIWTHSGTKFYLPTSPEFALKKHLSGRPHDCFAICHCFRDLESAGPHHRPEFLMLEYYLVNKNLNDLKISLTNYIGQFLKIEFIDIKLPSGLPDNEPDFNLWFLNEFEPSIPSGKAVFITGYPAFLSPLAQKDRKESGRSKKQDGGDNFSRNFNAKHLTEAKNLSPNPARSKEAISLRFELYINGIEIANGCEENRNTEQILQSFEAEQSYRRLHGLPLHPYSSDFAAASAHIPLSAGVGVGLDRLLMVINGQKKL